MSTEGNNGRTSGYDLDRATGPATDPLSRSDSGLSRVYSGPWTSLKTALFAGDLFAGEQYERDYR